MPPIVRDAFRLSLTSGPLHAAEASINAARYRTTQLPPGEATSRLAGYLDACWLSCMFLFSAGQESVEGTISSALESATDLNQQSGLRAISEAVKTAHSIAGTNTGLQAVAGQIERHLFDCGQLIDCLFGAGKIEGRALQNGIQADLPRPDEHKKV